MNKKHRKENYYIKEALSILLSCVEKRISHVIYTQKLKYTLLLALIIAVCSYFFPGGFLRVLLIRSKNRYLPSYRCLLSLCNVACLCDVN